MTRQQYLDYQRAYYRRNREKLIRQRNDRRRDLRLTMRARLVELGLWPYDNSAAAHQRAMRTRLINRVLALPDVKPRKIEEDDEEKAEDQSGAS